MLLPARTRLCRNGTVISPGVTGAGAAPAHQHPDGRWAPAAGLPGKTWHGLGIHCPKSQHSRLTTICFCRGGGSSRKMQGKVLGRYFVTIIIATEMLDQAVPGTVERLLSALSTLEIPCWGQGVLRNSRYPPKPGVVSPLRRNQPPLRPAGQTDGGSSTPWPQLGGDALPVGHTQSAPSAPRYIFSLPHCSVARLHARSQPTCCHVKAV